MAQRLTSYGKIECGTLFSFGFFFRLCNYDLKPLSKMSSGHFSLGRCAQFCYSSLQYTFYLVICYAQLVAKYKDLPAHIWFIHRTYGQEFSIRVKTAMKDLDRLIKEAVSTIHIMYDPEHPHSLSVLHLRLTQYVQYGKVIE